LNIPAFLVSIALSIVSQSIKSRINTDLFELKPIDYVKKCTASVVFICGKDDGLVRPERAKKMFDKYKGSKKVFLLSEGGHSDEREEEINEQAYEIIKKEFFASEMEDVVVDKRINESYKKNNKRIKPNNLPFLFKNCRESKKVAKEIIAKRKAENKKTQVRPSKEQLEDPQAKGICIKKSDSKNYNNQFDKISKTAENYIKDQK